jgi:tetratricopeptide (TPR) repeat protein
LEQVIGLEQTAHPRHWAAVSGLGWCHLAMGSFPAARASFEQVLQSTEVHVDERNSASDGLRKLHDQLGQAYYRSQEFIKAASEYESLLSLYSDDDGSRCAVLLWLADCRMRLGAGEHARECYEALLASPHATSEQRQEATEALSALPPRIELPEGPVQ